MCATVTARRRRVTSTRSPREALKRLAPSSAGGTRRRAEGYGHGVRGTFTTRARRPAGQKTRGSLSARLLALPVLCPPLSHASWSRSARLAACAERVHGRPRRRAQRLAAAANSTLGPRLPAFSSSVGAAAFPLAVFPLAALAPSPPDAPSGGRIDVASLRPRQDTSLKLVTGCAAAEARRRRPATVPSAAAFGIWSLSGKV